MSLSDEEYDIMVVKLQDLAQKRQTVDTDMALEVRRWREKGATWYDIGCALGQTRQAAHSMFSRWMVKS